MSVLTLGVNADNDLWVTASGLLETKVDEAAMSDLITQRLSSLTGEFLFDKARGIPYMETIFLVGRSGVGALRTSMRAALLDTTGVVAVPFIQAVIPADDANELQFTAAVVTEYGIISASRGV